MAAGSTWDNLFDQLSTAGNNALIRLQSMDGAVGDAIAAARGGRVDWDPDFLDLLAQIDRMKPDSDAVRHGAHVAPEYGAMTGLMLGLAKGRRVKVIALSDVIDRMAAGQAVFIGGADTGLPAFVDQAVRLQGATGGHDLVLQYVGLDAEHWQLPAAVRLLEVNVLKTAVIQLVNSALNLKGGAKSAVVSTSFAAWLVNRSLQALKRESTAGARNLQIDAFGPVEALQELRVVKQANFGRICNARSNWAHPQMAARFEVPPAVLAQLPVDVIPKLATPG
jgi:hypothetical protein